MLRFASKALLILVCALGVPTGHGQSGPPVPREIRDHAQIFIERVIVAKGMGAAPTDRPLSDAQKAGLALRAAKVLAVRELAETLSGIRITGDTDVRDISAGSDVVRTRVDGMVKGAEVVHESYDRESEMAVVFVRLPLDGPQGVIGALTPTILAEEKRAPASNIGYSPPIDAQSAPPAPVDALIIDATGTAVEPAMCNRILGARGAVLYGPHTIAPQVLARRGCGDYSRDVDKARAILRERGGQNPLVIRAIDVERYTDLRVSDEDAERISRANKGVGFLEGARVVFIL